MKKLIYASFFIAMAAVTGCTGTATTGGENNAFILNGNATGLDGEYLYLAYEANNGMTKDSALVANGQFKFAGNLAYFMTEGTLFTKEGERPSISMKAPRTNLHLEATEMTIELNGNDFSNARLKGSLTQEQVDSVYTPLIPLLEEANKLQYNELRTEKNLEKLAEHKKRVQEIRQQYTTAIENFIKTHPDSYYTVEQLSMRTGNMSLEEMEEAYNKLSPKLKASRAGNAIKKELDVLKSVAPGQPAPDFTTSDLSGYKLVIAPMLYLTGKDTISNLVRYVENGGALYGTYMLGTVDVNDLCYLGGIPGNGLKDVFGLVAEEMDTLYLDERRHAKVQDMEYELHDYCETVKLTGARAVAMYTDGYYRETPAVTEHAYGKGIAFYQACRDTGALKEKVLSDLMERLEIASCVDAKAPLPHGVTAHSRTDGVSTYVFVENYLDREAPTVYLKNEMENLLTGEVTTQCPLPPYGFGIFKSK